MVKMNTPWGLVNYGRVLKKKTPKINYGQWGNLTETQVYFDNENRICIIQNLVGSIV